MTPSTIAGRQLAADMPDLTEWVARIEAEAVRDFRRDDIAIRAIAAEHRAEARPTVEQLAEALHSLDGGPDGIDYRYTFTIDSMDEFAAAILAALDRAAAASAPTLTTPCPDDGCILPKDHDGPHRDRAAAASAPKEAGE